MTTITDNETTEQDEIFREMEVITTTLREQIVALRRIKGGGPGVEWYGGKGYRRHLSIAITAIEAALLRLGTYIDDEDED